MKYSQSQYVQALHEAIQDTDARSHDRVIENFIQTLKANGDLGSYEAIIKEYETYDKQQRGVKDIEITTAGAKVNKALITDLNKLVGKNIDVIQKHDDKIIGGVVIKVDDTLIDGSIKNHLENLGKALKE
jgi:F-type H+-transporting ATPase subunit delta